MTTARFVSPDFPTEHPGVQRAEALVDHARDAMQRISAARSLSAMLLAAVVASLLVVADQVVDQWADGQWLAVWIALWVIAFTGLVLAAPITRSFARQWVAALDAQAARRARARADARLLALAARDPRVMADLQAAQTRAAGERAVGMPVGRRWEPYMYL
jgi:hypothetical protein